MASRKKITSAEATSTGSTEIMQQYLFDSDSNLSSLSEDSSSEESGDCPDERILSETNEEVIIESDEDLKCDKPVRQDAESISDKDCSTSSTISAKKRKWKKYKQEKGW